MEFRLAVKEDLSQIKIMYREIIKNMDENQINIWDDVYPCEFFDEDIKNNRLFLLLDNDVILSAFALCDTSIGEESVKWKDNSSNKVLYLERLAVNINYLRRGIGILMLNKAKEIAKSLNAEYLRLFVVDINKPAIKLYIKNGFIRALGIYNEVIDEELVLHEYGYEIEL